jgi:predicted N-acetyltransferase YhbS
MNVLEPGRCPISSLILEPAADRRRGEPIERLNERVFGPGRFARTAYRIREDDGR